MAPTIVSYTASAWDGANKSTASISWQTGDLVVVVGLSADKFWPLNDPTATGLTFVDHGTPAGAGAGSDVAWAMIWTATAGSNDSQVVSITENGDGQGFGIFVWVIRNHDGFNATSFSSGATSSATGSLSCTLTGPDSVVIFGGADYNQVVTPTAWTPGSETERRDATDSFADTFIADWTAQAAGTRSYGSTTASGLATAMKAIEVLAAAASSTPRTGRGLVVGSSRSFVGFSYVGDIDTKSTMPLRPRRHWSPIKSAYALRRSQ